MIPRPLCLALVLLYSLPSLARQANDNTTSEECKRYLQTPLPAEASRVPSPKQWPGCKSYKLYSGIGAKVDYNAARNCAWSERLAQQASIEPVDTSTYSDTIANIYGGSGMLAILYSNGEGVERNKALALRFGCESVLEGALLKQIEADDKINYCSDVAYTTFAMNFCAAWNSEIAAQRRQTSLDTLMQTWPQRDRQAFALLHKASESYIQAHGLGEVYQGGTIRGIRTNGVEEHQREKFMEAVQSFESGHKPGGTLSDFRKADADLNVTYKKALALAAAQNFNEDDGLIHPEGIRDAERAWLKYRNAWLIFAKLHYPNTDQNAWMTLLTRNRFWSLRATLCNVGWKDPACRNADNDM